MTGGADPRSANGPLAVVDVDTDDRVLAYCTGGLVLDVPAKTLPSLVEWTLKEAKLGQPRLSGPGKDAGGAIGRLFDETGTGFGEADSLGGYLAELAGQLERGQEAGVVTFNGRLFWEGPPPARPECSADEPLPAPDEQLPELDLSHSPTDLLHVSYLDGHEELGALIATLPYEQVVEAARKQLPA